MISDGNFIDITGIELIPGNGGKDCPGNGEHTDKNGHLIECCCDECDFAILCEENNSFKKQKFLWFLL